MIQRHIVRNWSLITVSFLHVLWGVLLICSADPLGVTALGNSSFGPSWLVGIAYLTSALLSVFARADVLWRMAFLVPQYFLLVLSSLTAFHCIINGAYFDGVQRPRTFILADQVIYPILLLFYTLAAFDWFLFSRLERTWTPK